MGIFDQLLGTKVAAELALELALESEMVPEMELAALYLDWIYVFPSGACARHLHQQTSEGSQDSLGTSLEMQSEDLQPELRDKSEEF